MANIPGLLVCPADEGSDDGFQMPSFTGTITVPNSQIHGNCKLLSDFRRLDTIHEGSFGITYKCEDLKTKEIVALKKFKMPTYEKGFPRSVLREINILNTLKNDNIVNSHGLVAGKKLDVNFLIMDYGVFSLKELLDKKFDDIHQKAVVKCIFKQFLRGLDFIHNGLIIHRNICTKNIMFTEKGLVKIAGIHSSRFYNRGNMTPGVTDFMFRAPELLFGAKMYGPAVDMWSSGCVLACLLLKKPLFVGESEMEVLKSIFELLGTPCEKIWPGFDLLFSQYDNNTRIISKSNPYRKLKQCFDGESPATKEIVQDLLVYFPNERFEASQCITSLYFEEKPPACSLNELAAIIRKASGLGGGASDSEPMNVG